MSGTQQLPVTEIICDMLLQPRAELHRDWVEEYARDMAAGATFPPIVVFHDGSRYWLADGFHRHYATQAAGAQTILVDIRPGSRRDALLYSLSANASHGYRRTNADKRRAVDIMLADPEWSKLTDREIAEVCLVGDRFISSRRREKIPASDITEADEAHPALDPDAEQSACPGEEWIEGDGQDVDLESVAFDWDAAKLRNTAMEAIRALAELPDAKTVLAAWMKSNSYGEPVETLESASAWLNAFVALYRRAEPERWERVQMMAREDVAHAAQ